MLLRMDWSMLSQEDRVGVLQYATTLCHTVTETVTARSTQFDKGADKDSKKLERLSIDQDHGQDQDKDKTKASFYAPLSPAAAIACLSQLHALGNNYNKNNNDAMIMTWYILTYSIEL